MPEFSPLQAAEIIRLIPSYVQQELEAEQAVVILDIEADFKQHVFHEGRDTSGTLIGTYSTDPIYVSLEEARNRYGSQIPTSKLRGRGKNRRGTKFLNGNPRRSMFFGDGYKGFRDLMGRPTDKVNLNLTDNLRSSIVSGTEGNVSTIDFLNGEMEELAAHLEKKYGTVIFEVPEQYVEAAFEQLTAAGQRAIDKLLGR